MEVMEAIKGRRSVRKYAETPITDADLEDLLEAARWAPSWANTQCWRLVVVKDKVTRAQLAETINPGNRAADGVRNAPIVIVACAQLGLAGYYKGTVATDKGDWFMFDVALAMHNLTLAAHAHGLGTVHVGLFDAKKAAQVISAPNDVAVVEILPVGHPEVVPQAPPRKELSEFVFYDKYGAPTA